MRRVMTLLAVLLAVPLPAAEPEKKDAARPPYERLLQGDDAKKAAELAKRLAQREDADDYAEAIRTAEQLLELRRRVEGDEHYETADARRAIETLRTIAARPAAERAAWREALRAADSAAARSRQGAHAEALPAMRQLLELRRRVLGDDHPDTARSRNNVAMILIDLGRYAEAEPQLRQALAARQKALGDDHPDTAQGYNNLAFCLHDLGRYADAEALCRRALALRQRLLGDAHPDTNRALSNVAFNLHVQRKYSEAEPLFRKVLDATRQAQGEDNADTALSLLCLGGNLNAQGKYADADPYLRRALDVSRKTAGANHSSTANACNNVGGNLYDQGRYADAEVFFREALAINRKARGELHPETAGSYLTVAGCLCARGEYAAALPVTEAAVRAYEAACLRASAAGLARATFASTLTNPWPFLALLRARRGESAAAWEALESFLGRALLDELAARVPRQVPPEERERQEALGRQLDRLDAQVLAATSRRDPTDEQRKELERLVAERAGLEGQLSDMAVARLRREIATLADAQAALPADAALVSWLDRRGEPKAAEPGGEHWACVVRRDGPPAWLRLPGSGAGGAWTAEDQTLHRRVHRALSGAGKAGEGADDLRRLAVQRLAPLGPHLDGVRRLIVLMPGSLAGLPLEALTERYTISYCPSATVLTRLRARPAAEGRDLLALGDPDFPDTAGRESLPALPGTRREVEALARLVPRADVLLGRDASALQLAERATADRLRGYRYVHLATHGLLDERRPLRSALALTGGERLTAARLLESWRLDADLVVLSACRTALGQWAAGEGYLGFSQVLFAAGARSCVLSLWQADDTATALLMVRYYENLLGKRAGLEKPLAKAEALREAKEWLRNLDAKEIDTEVARLPQVRGSERTRPPATTAARPFQHPYYWSAFILIGDPQ